MKNNIAKLIKKNLCYQCGTCKSICVSSAITMENLKDRGLVYPTVDNNKCIDCGLCLKVCPINNIDFNEEHIPEKDNFIGIYNTKNEKRIDFTASGGIVTELIDYLFKNKDINKAIVTGMSKTEPAFSKVYIIENTKMLKEVGGSVYQPVSVNEALDNINKEDKVAFVGLPCHMRGLELYLQQKPNYKQNFIIKIGLICSIGRGRHGTEVTLKNLLNKSEISSIKKIKYRYGMPPGNTVVELRDGTNKEVSCSEFYQNTDYIFMPKGCLFCNDLFNDKADVTVGDPWGLNKGKKSMVIIRSSISKNILDKMVDEEIISFDQKLSVEECIKTQNHSVNYKIKSYSKRVNAYKKIRVAVPYIKNLKDQKSSIKEKIGYNMLMINSLVFNSKFGLRLVSSDLKKIIIRYRNIIMRINTK